MYGMSRHSLSLEIFETLKNLSTPIVTEIFEKQINNNS